MERLTIKEIAPYLPYDLRMKGRNTEYPLEGCHLDEWFNWGEMTEDKPILRPLSQLTEEIEHNGERFVPIDELCFRDTVEAFKEFPEQQHNLIPHIRYMDVEKLFEWHFDVFGLIGRGLALPIDGKEVKP